MLLHSVSRRITIARKVIKTLGRALSGGKIEGNIVKSCFPDVELPKVNLTEFVEPYFDKFEKFIAIECSTTKRKYSYGEINRKSGTLSKGLRKFWKLQNGDVVAVVLSNVPEYPIVNLGILKANLIVTPISSIFTADEIGSQLLEADVKLVITEVELYSKVRESIRKASKKLPIITVKTRNDQSIPDNTTDFHELVNTEIDYPDVTPRDSENVATIIFSSGTTGMPKGVQLTHNNLVMNICQHNYPEVQYLEEASGDFQEVLPTIIPFYHAFAYNLVLSGLALYGGKIVTLSKYTTNSFVTILKEYKNSSTLYTVPPIFLMLSTNEDVKKEYLSNIRTILCAAAPSAYSDQMRFQQKFGDHITFTQGYGLTEATCVSTFTYPNIMKAIKSNYQGSVGVPVINSRLKIVAVDDPDEKPLGPGNKGEIFINGPHVMKGYYNRPEESKTCLTEDGWLRTGDVGYYNEEGLLFITDRIKDLIKVKAYQVAPAELEAIIRSFPGISEAAVIGIPDERSGEVPRAYVVPKSGEALDTKKLNEFVSGKVAQYKQLKGGVAIVGEIPKSVSGKILRRKLKQEFLSSGK